MSSCAVSDKPDSTVVEIPYGAKLPDILWKFHRRCGKHILIANPHFYPDTPFKEEVVREVLPLRGRDEKEAGRWTQRVYVYGDSREGRIRLTSQDGTIAKLFGVVTQCLGRPLPLTIFKGLLASWDNSLGSHGFYRYRGASTDTGRS